VALLTRVVPPSAETIVLRTLQVVPAPFKVPGSNVWKWREADIVSFICEQKRST
jgi:hypothetical protein